MLHVRSRAEPIAAADLPTAGLTAETEVALGAEGPFEKLAVAAKQNGRLRDRLAAALDAPSLRTLPKVRTAILAATAGPIVMILELDRELVVGRVTSPARAAMDLLMAAFVVFELTRRTPRLPGVAAVVMAAFALKFFAFIARPCAHGVNPLVYAAAGLALLSAVALATRVPTRRRIVLELLDRMQITRSQWLEVTRPKEPEGPIVGVAIAAAVGLPGLLYLMRSGGLSIEAQGVMSLAFGVAMPLLARRVAGERVLRPPSAGATPWGIVLGVVAGAALTFALLSAGRDFFQSGTDVARCVDRLDKEAKRALEMQSTEIARALSKVRSSSTLLFFTAIVFPFVEERIYRGLLLDVLVRKYGVSYGVFASALVFGVAHYGIYEVALYQTVLLGIGFGIAWLEGGLIAAFAVHATWNILMLV